MKQKLFQIFSLLIVIGLFFAMQGSVQGAALGELANDIILAPVPLSPAEGDVITTDQQVTFSWETMGEGVASYHLVLERVSPTMEILDEDYGSAENCDAETCSVTNTTLLAVGEYRWRLKANVENPDVSLWSDWVSFSVNAVEEVTLVSPFNGATPYSQTPTLDWKDVEGASGYVIQYASDAGFSTPTEETTTESTFTPSSDLALGEWFWRVKTTDGSWSSVWRFNIIEPSADDFVFTTEKEVTIEMQGEFEVPVDPSYSYNFNVDCNNDGIDEGIGVTGNFACNIDYSVGFVDGAPYPYYYTIRIKDNVGDGTGYPHICFNLSSNSGLVHSVEQWGSMKWQSLVSAFRGTNLYTMPISESPDLSNITSLEEMFYGSNLQEGVAHWDVSGITNMKGMFREAYGFNEDITGWDVSNVTNMSQMFYDTNAFNRDISTWNVSSVTDMTEMFYQATGFAQNLGPWDISSLEDATDMFGLITLPKNSYEALLISWSSKTVKNNVPFGAGESHYCTAEAEAAKNSLINDYQWIISDGGQNCDLEAPRLLWPEDRGSTGEDLTPTFDWMDEMGATGYVIQYGNAYGIAETTTYSAEAAVTDSEYTPTVGVFSDSCVWPWYWRVKAVGDGIESDWSEDWHFCPEPKTVWSDEFGYGTGWENPETPRTAADVNGDGLADLIGFAADGVYIALNTSSDFEASTLWLNAFGSDPAAGGWGGENSIRTAADVNGDGLADIVGFGDFGVMVSLSTGTGFEAPIYWIYGYGSHPAMGGWSSTDNNRVVADVNGDGMADVVGYADYGVLVSLSTGSSFEPAQYWVMGYGRLLGGWDGIQNPRMIADINGDGCGDVVGFGNFGVVASLSNACADTPSNSFGGQTYWTYGYGYELGGWDSTRHIRTFSDVDGDGDDDLVGFGDNGVLVSLSDGASTFGGAEYWKLGAYGYVSGGWDVNLHPRVVLDVNGNGFGDIIGFATDGVIISLSTGLYFN